MYSYHIWYDIIYTHLYNMCVCVCVSRKVKVEVKKTRIRIFDSVEISDHV